MKTVQQMRNSLTTGKLLSCYNAPWWLGYTQNNSHFDNYFARRYKSFVYFDQEESDSISTVTDNFIKAVYDHLLVNDKRYTELYRINVVPDDESYSILENYYLESTTTENTNIQSALTSGQRSDITDNKIGNQNLESIDKRVGHNSSSENLSASSKTQTGTRNDISQFTKGKETDTSQSNTVHTITDLKHGAIGVMTADQVLDIHRKTWENMTAFYDFVFREIAEQYLLIGD